MKPFFKLVEIQTKIASVTPFVWAVVFTGYTFQTLRPFLLLFFFISMLAFDMFTTTLNNYQDWKRANKRHGYNYERHNAIVRYGMSEKSILLILAALFIIAVISGFIVFMSSDIMVLILGILSFLTGILYSAGPLPISRTPLGEIFSGFFMGYMLPFIAIYLSLFAQKPIHVNIDNTFISFVFNWQILIPVTLILIPTTLLIAGIMLANNICDIEDDIANKRHTLPILVGKRKSLVIFYTLYILCYLDVLLSIALGYLPALSLLTLLPSYWVIKNLRAFSKVQTKKETFKYAVLNMILIMVPLVLTVLLTWIL